MTHGILKTLYSNILQFYFKIKIRFQADEPLCDIKAKLEKYGKITNIELARTKTDLHFIEIYLTYENSVDAYEAFKVNHKKFPEIDENPLPSTDADLVVSVKCSVSVERSVRFSEVIQIWPANTWHQPQAPQLILDEWSDDELPEAEVYEFHINRWPLAIHRRHAKSRVRDFKGFLLTYHENTSTNIDQYVCDEYEQRATFKVASQVSANLQSLTVRRNKDREMPMELVYALRPALKHLTRLEWYTSCTCDILDALRTLCPKLQELIVHMQGIVCAQKSQHNSLEFPSLEYFHYHNVYIDEGQTLLRRFVECNPQLKHLSLGITDPKLLEALAEHSVALEHLEIWRRPFAENGVDRILGLLRNLPKLQTLILRYSSTNDLDDVRRQSKQLSRVTQVKVIVVIRNIRASWGGHTDLVPYLHHFVEVLTQNNVLSIKIGPNTRHIQMVDGRRYLVNVVNTRQAIDSWYPNLHDHIVDGMKSISGYFCEDGELDVYDLDDMCCQYVHVNSGPLKSSRRKCVQHA